MRRRTGWPMGGYCSEPGTLVDVGMFVDDLYRNPEVYGASAFHVSGFTMSDCVQAVQHVDDVLIGSMVHCPKCLEAGLRNYFPTDMGFEQDEKKLLQLCQELDRASRLPWVLLSAGADFTTFGRQVEIACKAGASGFLAGRALWQEGVQIRSREERMNFFKNTAAPRLKKLSEMAKRYGKPWHTKMGSDKGDFEAAR